MSRKEELLQEIKLRRLVRKALKIRDKKKKLEEQKLRRVVRHLIAEGLTERMFCKNSLICLQTLKV